MVKPRAPAGCRACLQHAWAFFMTQQAPLPQGLVVLRSLRSLMVRFEVGDAADAGRRDRVRRGVPSQVSAKCSVSAGQGASTKVRLSRKNCSVATRPCDSTAVASSTCAAAHDVAVGGDRDGRQDADDRNDGEQLHQRDAADPAGTGTGNGFHGARYREGVDVAL